MVRALIGFALLQVGNILVAAAVLVPRLSQFNSHLLIALLPLLAAFLLFTVIVSQNHLLYRKTQDLQGEVQNNILQTYEGKKTIKNFNAEKSFVSRFAQESWEELRNFYKAGVRVSFSIPLIPLGSGLSLVWGAWVIKAENLGAGGLVLYSSFVFLFLEPMMFVSWIGVVFTRSHGAWQRIAELVKDLDTSSPEEERLIEDNPPGQVKKGRLVLKFWGEYLPFNYAPLAWTALVGKTGCGKSYLLKQMATTLTKASVPIHFVDQIPYLYNDTLGKNIFLGHLPSEKEKEEALSLLRLFALDFLAGENENLLELEVGEKGKYLSGGQVKRLALVRSLMGKATVLLWDDPFSSVDLILEKQIISDLKSLEIMKNKTVLLTSHRITTVRACDEVHLLEKGEGVVEKGLPQELLMQGKKTYTYFENQMV